MHEYLSIMLCASCFQFSAETTSSCYIFIFTVDCRQPVQWQTRRFSESDFSISSISISISISTIMVSSNSPLTLRGRY